MSSKFGMRQIGKLLVGLVACLAVATVVADSAVTPGSKAAKLGECVAPTLDMRKNHMDMLKHDRDRAVRIGVKKPQFSLSECISCHAEKDNAGGYEPVNAEGQFCESCHSYVAVNLTCFQCHRTTPEEVKKLSALPGAPHHSLTAQHGKQPAAITQE